MNFRVGPYLYRVRHVPGYITHEGDRCLGLCDNERHELMISDQCSSSQQIQVVCHEYMEAWLYHFGEHLEAHPDKEGYCDLFGVAMTQFVLDFIHEHQAGDPAARATHAAAPRCVHEEFTEPDEQATRWRLRVYEPAAGP